MFESITAQNNLDATLRLVKRVKKLPATGPSGAAEVPVTLRSVTYTGSDVDMGKPGTAVNNDRVLTIPPIVEEPLDVTSITELGLTQAHIGDVLFLISATDIPEGEAFLQQVEWIIYNKSTLRTIEYRIVSDYLVAGKSLLYYLVGRGHP